MQVASFVAALAPQAPPPPLRGLAVSVDGVNVMLLSMKAVRICCPWAESSSMAPSNCLMPNPEKASQADLWQIHERSSSQPLCALEASDRMLQVLSRQAVTNSARADPLSHRCDPFTLRIGHDQLLPDLR